MYALPAESTATAGCDGSPDVLAPILMGLLIASARAASASASALATRKPIRVRRRVLHIGRSNSRGPVSPASRRELTPSVSRAPPSGGPGRIHEARQVSTEVLAG